MWLFWNGGSIIIVLQTWANNHHRIVPIYLQQTFYLASVLKFYNSDSQSLLRGPLVVREINWSGPRIPIYINILSFADHQIFVSGPRTKKVWEPLF